MVERPLGVGVVVRLRRHSGFGGALGLNWLSAAT